MRRRGFLGFLGGTGIAFRRAQAEQAIGQRFVVGPPTGQSGSLAGVSLDSPKMRTAWRVFDETVRPQRRIERRKDISRALLAGYPPQVASSFSWAPWFRASVAARILDEEQARAEDFFTAMRRQIVGDT